MSVPRNMTAAPAAELLARSMLSSRPIEQMESEGQRQLVASAVLPTKGLEHPAFAAWGIRIGTPVDGDPLFTHVELPAGWTKSATEHAMHSTLVDGLGRERGDIFYKAAFYDRRADIYPTCRFSAATVYPESDAGTVAQVTRKDAGGVLTVLHRVERLWPAGGKDQPAAWSVRRAAAEEAVAWLAERYPHYTDPAAYWDDGCGEHAAKDVTP